MKTLLLALTICLVSLRAFAQGHIGFVNDSEHLYVLTTNITFLHPADTGLAGQFPPGPFPSGVTLVSGLYAGTSSTSLTLQTSTTLLTGTGLLVPGRQVLRNTVLTVPGGVPQWFQVAIWDSAYPSPDLSGVSRSYVGFSPLFTATPSTSILTYPSIMPGSPANSTYPDGNLVVGIPEPSALALLGLGALFFTQLHRKPPFKRL